MIGPTALCPSGIGIAFFDLDNTILTDGVKISPRVMDAITQAREHGCMACVSSGRALHMVPSFLTGPDAMDYLVCSNGAYVHDTIGGVLYERLMERDQVLALMDALEPLKAGWNAFIGGSSYFEWRCMSYFMAGSRAPIVGALDKRALHTGGTWRVMRRGMRFAKRIIFRREGMKQVMRVRPYVEASEGGIPKVGCSLPSEEACERAMVIIDHMGGFQVARMSDVELEVTATGANKGAAARWLMDYLGIEPASAVAFGDSENDASLAEACGTFVVMENGDGRVKELADDICESVYDDGVARWLERAMAEADGAKHV